MRNLSFEDYMEILQKPRVELIDFSFVLAGIRLSSRSYKARADLIENYGVGVLVEPWFHEDFPEDEGSKAFLEYVLQILETLACSIQNDQISSDCLKLEYPNYNYESVKKYPHLKNHTYIFSPMEGLSVILGEGMILSPNLQTSIGIMQASPRTERLGKKAVNELRRDAVFQYYWFEYPTENISSICRRTGELKGVPEFSFMHACDYTTNKKGNGARPRLSAKRMQPRAGKVIEPIPGVICWEDGNRKIDFVSLKIVARVFADLVFFQRKFKKFSELLSIDLFQSYICGNLFVEKIVLFYFPRKFKTFDLIGSIKSEASIEQKTGCPFFSSKL